MAVTTAERPPARDVRAAASSRTVALAALVFTRLPILIVGVLAVSIVGTTPPPVAEALWRVAPKELPNLLARWDTYYYRSIAVDGYSWTPSVFRHENVVFFPLYPLLMRAVGTLIGGHPLLAGLLISLVAFTAGIALLHRLAILELGRDLAWRSVLLLVTFPYALFFSAVYTESLFLLLSVGAFYAMRRGRSTPAALAGFAAALARPNGWLLSLPLIVLAWTQNPPARGDRAWNARRLAALAAACAPLIGVAAFSAFLHVRFDDGLAWVHGQRAWGVPLLGLPSAPDPTRLPWQPRYPIEEVITWIGNGFALGLAVAAILPVAGQLGAAYAIWIAVNIFPPVATHLLLSLGRFTSVLFPVFFWLAGYIRPRRLIPVVGAFAAAQIILAVWFFLWRPVV
jgi:hypothetical protein